MFKRRNPESPESLNALHPSRYYTFEEITEAMSLLYGVAFDGLLFKSWQVVEETPGWFNVEVTFDNQFSLNDLFENWYFFKQPKEAHATEDQSDPDRPLS